MGTRAFTIFELFLIALFLYLIVNMARYLFFKASHGGWGLELSDWWIKKDREQMHNGKKHKSESE